MDSEEDEQCINIIQKELIPERIVEDIMMFKTMKACLKEVRKTLKALGIITIKEAKIKEGGESIKVQKE
jgi:hypothetical protein